VSFVDPYVYPGTQVLRNKFGLQDPKALDLMERWLTTQRRLEGCPEGQFDAAHLKAIHRHIFQDLFDWAGEFRRIEIAKGGNQFQFHRFVSTGLANIHDRLMAADMLVGRSRADFAEAASSIIGDLNYVHPFRDGNGRTQIEYLRQLAWQAGLRFRIDAIEPEAWIEASKRAHMADYRPFAVEILRGLGG